MKVKSVSVFIIVLCLLSVIVGLFAVNKKQELTETCPDKTKGTFFERFSVSGDRIAKVTLQGPIAYSTSGSFLADPRSAEQALGALNRAYEDKNVKGIIFRVNSPGGTVAMSQEIYNTILRARQKKPVIVSMADVAASGGYYISSAADRIYANPGTLTGSVGVILETINARQLLTDKLGVESEVIKSGVYKDTGTIYRPLTDNERELLNNLVNNAYKQFLDGIAAGRIKRDDDYNVEKVELSEENMKKYSDGRIFTGQQAFEYGFIDKMGGFEEAVEDIRKMAKQKFPSIPSDIQVVNYNRPVGVGEFLFSISNNFFPGVNSFKSFIPFSRSYPRQPLYLWE